MRSEPWRQRLSNSYPCQVGEDRQTVFVGLNKGLYFIGSRTAPVKHKIRMGAANSGSVFGQGSKGGGVEGTAESRTNDRDLLYMHVMHEIAGD
jgi:hypothetical protein